MYAVDYPPRVAVTTEVAIFTLQDDQLKAFLVGHEADTQVWQLPGEIVQATEDLESSARRGLLEGTGLNGVYIEQLYTFGGTQREFRGHTITVAYFALLPADRATPGTATDSGNTDWFAFHELPALSHKDREILAMAQERLLAKLDYSNIALQLMPAVFSLSELQRVYETIRQEKLDKRNFRKRILALDIIEETGEFHREGAHRPAKLYRAREHGRVRIIK